MNAPRILHPGPRKLLIEERPGWVATLFGLPFLAGGLWFTYQLAVAVFIYFTRVAFRDFLQALAAFGMILLFGLCFGVPGVLLVLFRKRVLIDAAKGTVTDSKSYFFFSRTTRHPMKSFTAVSVEWREFGRDSHGDNDTQTFHAWHVELCRGGKDRTMLALMDQRESAEALGKEVAMLVGIGLRTGHAKRKK